MIRLRCTLSVALALVWLWPASALAQEGDDSWPPLTEKETIQWVTPDDPAPPVVDENAPPPPEDDVRFLPGRAMRCRNIMGDNLACCSETITDQNEAWWDTYRETMRPAFTARSACTASEEKATYQAGADHRTMQRPLTSERESIDGGGEPVQCGEGGRLNTVQEAFMAKENEEVKDDQSWYCNQEEFELAASRNVGECLYVGTMCASDVLGYCVTEKQVYCCFNSPVSKEIRASLVESGMDLGTAKEPRCGGVPLGVITEEVIEGANTRQVQARMAMGKYIGPVNTGRDIESDFTGSGSTIGNEGRQSVTTRTMQTVSEIDYDASVTSIENDLYKTLPTERREYATGPGQISIGTVYPAHHDSRARFTLTRTGGEGAVSATVATSPPRSYQAGYYEAVPPTVVTWADGDTEPQVIGFQVGSFYGVTRLQITLTNPTGGAIIEPFDTRVMVLHGKETGDP